MLLPPDTTPHIQTTGYTPNDRSLVAITLWQHLLSLAFFNSILLQKCLPTSDGSSESFPRVCHISLPEQTVCLNLSSEPFLALSCSTLTYTGKADKIHRTRTYWVLLSWGLSIHLTLLAKDTLCLRSQMGTTKDSQLTLKYVLVTKGDG